MISLRNFIKFEKTILYNSKSLINIRNILMPHSCPRISSRKIGIDPEGTPSRTLSLKGKGE
jgi:hypothetical protein